MEENGDDKKEVSGMQTEHLKCKMITGIFTLIYWFLPEMHNADLNPMVSHNFFCLPADLFYFVSSIHSKILAYVILFILWLFTWWYFNILISGIRIFWESLKNVRSVSEL